MVLIIIVAAIQKAYFHYRIIRSSILHDRKPFACSLAPTLACNLACSFCYTASPRAAAKGQRTQQPKHEELTVDAFKEMCLKLHKRGIKHATLTDGEPLLTEQSREKCKVATEIFDQTWIVTNGTFGLPRFRNTLYIVSLDGDEETHDLIRGKGVFAKIKQNISSSISVDCYCNTTLSRLNHGKLQSIVEAARKLGANGISFAWSTPMSPKDTLHLSHAERQKDIDEIQRLKRLFYRDYILNSDEELELMRTNQWSSRCPTWFVESYDAYGDRKPTCVFGKATPFMCENCGCNIYPSILTILERRKSTLISKLAFSIR
ncbi:MAG TPA: radical SAM protein [Nitrososphaeraceae archaeon]|nr:radical SAM protein [Nitrososphaeraceae archaeon]